MLQAGKEVYIGWVVRTVDADLTKKHNVGGNVKVFIEEVMGRDDAVSDSSTNGPNTGSFDDALPVALSDDTDKNQDNFACSFLTYSSAIAAVLISSAF